VNGINRFRHVTDNKQYETMQAGIKMTIMARPVLSKTFFELTSLVVSAVNGCQACVNSHEIAVRNEGALRSSFSMRSALEQWSAACAWLCTRIRPQRSEEPASGKS
jgi:AhpD family alkylhydroperoxidase